MNRLDIAARASLILAALSVSAVALVGAWSLTTRTTATASGWPAVYRENLITGAGEFCTVRQDKLEAVCGPHFDPAQPFTRDFSNRAVPTP